MTVKELTEKVNALKTETHDALQLVWDATNKGQRQKLLRNEQIKAMLERYNIVTEEAK